MRTPSIEGEEDPFDIVLDLGQRGKRKIEIIKPDIVSSNAILEELKSFHDSILKKSIPVVSHLDGSAAMDLAFEIMSKMYIAGQSNNLNCYKLVRNMKV